MKSVNYLGDDPVGAKVFGVLCALLLGMLITNLELKFLILFIVAVCVMSIILASPFGGLCLLAFTVTFAGLMKIIPGLLTVNKLLGGVVAVSFFIHLTVNRRNNDIQISGNILLYFLLAFLSLPSLLWFSDQLGGLKGLGARLSVIGLAFLISVIIRNLGQLKIFCASAATGAALMGFYVAVFGVENLVGEYGVRLAAGSNENVLAHALAVGLLLSSFLFIDASRARKILILVLNLFILIAIGLTGSRGTWLALIIPLIIIPIFNLRMGLRTRIASLVLVGTTILGIGYGITRNLFGYWGALVLDRISRLGESSDISAISGGRLSYIWPMYLEEIMQRPLFGGGFEVRNYILRASHNDILNILAELGLIGLLVFIALIWRLFSEIGRCEDHRIKFASFSLLCFLLVAGITHNTLFSKSFALGIGVLCCLPSICRNNQTTSARADSSLSIRTSVHPP